MTNDDKVSTADNVLQNNDVLHRVSSFHYNEPLSDIMEKDVFTCRPEDNVHSVAREMSKRKISSVIVTDDNLQPVGIVTERDIVKKLVAENADNIGIRKIVEIMTPDPIFISLDDTLFDALAVFSRHSIKHLPVVKNGAVVGIITLRQIMKLRYSEPFVIIGKLDNVSSPSEFKELKDDLIGLVQEKLSSRIDPVDVVTMLSLVNLDIHKRLLIKALDQEGPPPVDFCFFVTGSHGRRENLLFPDQDFCVIITDYEDRYFNEYDNYFYNLSRRFSDALDEAGFAYCQGNIMGQNPTWRKRISEWLLHLNYIFNRQGPYTVRYMTLIFDSAFLYGNHTLFHRYVDYAFQQLSAGHNILRQMHEEEEGAHRVPLGIFHSFITERRGPHKKSLDMKRSGLIFLIESARLLALRHGIRETSTLSRLRALVQKGVIHRDDSEYFENAYRVILHHTLMAQADNYLSKGSSDYFLNPYELSERSQELLKQAFRAISKLQEIVRSDFGELIL